jgi:hypothetical protein
VLARHPSPPGAEQPECRPIAHLLPNIEQSDSLCTSISQRCHSPFPLSLGYQFFLLPQFQRFTACSLLSRALFVFHRFPIVGLDSGRCPSYPLTDHFPPRSRLAIVTPVRTTTYQVSTSPSNHIGKPPAFLLLRWNHFCPSSEAPCNLQDSGLVLLFVCRRFAAAGFEASSTWFAHHIITVSSFVRPQIHH